MVQCPPGTPPADCVFTIVGHFQIRDAVHECKDRADVWCSPTNGTFPQTPFIKLVHVSPHCHGPSCLSMQMINADTNETLCYTEPYYGVTDKAMDELSYSAGIPPCIWGTADEGLLPPPLVSLDTNITVIGRSNATFGHWGQMGHFQMRGTCL